MEWITVGEPEVQKQRGKWVVRQAGYDPASGRRRVKQLATVPTKRAAAAYRTAVLAGRAGTDRLAVCHEGRFVGVIKASDIVQLDEILDRTPPV